MSSRNLWEQGLWISRDKLCEEVGACEGGQTTPRVLPAPSKLTATGRSQEEMGSGINFRIVATSL